MGFRDAVMSLLGSRRGAYQIEMVGSPLRDMVLGLTPEELYKTQPDLRSVISFVARNVAHLGVPVYERKADNSRERLHDDPLALLLRHPNPNMTRYELFNSLVSDIGLHDRAYWMVTPDSDRDSGWLLQPIPPSWVVEHRGGDAFSVGEYVIGRPGHERVPVPASNMIMFHGWNPSSPTLGTSPVETLRSILAEQIHAWEHRNKIWERGGRASNVITRPANAEWSDAARDRFITEWKQRWTGAGDAAGGTPILEDGMTIERMGFSAREDEWSEVSKVALAKVAAIYHVSPAMLGAADAQSFASMKEHRKMLYSETLGPMLAMIEDRVNTYLAPMVSESDTAYVEFNIQEKLQGDFEEQAVIMSTAVGGPWMARSEARARMNLPYMEGTDEMIVPLNVIAGGQASPQDGGTGASQYGQLTGLASLLRPVEAGELRSSVSAKARSVKAAPGDDDEGKVEALMRKFFARQRRSVLSELGSKSPSWWDSKRWDDELAEDLLELSLDMTTSAARSMLVEAGISPDQYSTAQTRNFLKSVARSRAGAINNATMLQVEAILDGDGPEGVTDPAHAFDIAEESRAGVIGVTLATTFAVFATMEAGKQTGAGTKTWIVTSGNPRPEHAAMNGETVGIDESFSNGAKGPGDPVLGADGVSGCSCEVEVTYG